MLPHDHVQNDRGGEQNEGEGESGSKVSHILSPGLSTAAQTLLTMIGSAAMFDFRDCSLYVPLSSAGSFQVRDEPPIP